MVEPIKPEVPSWTAYSVATAPFRAAIAVASAPYYAGAYAWSLVPSRGRPSTPAETPAPPPSPAKTVASEVEIKITVERAVSPTLPTSPHKVSACVSENTEPFIGPLSRTHIREVLNSFSS